MDFSTYIPPNGFLLDLVDEEDSSELAALERGAGWVVIEKAGEDRNAWFQFSVSIEPACSPGEARSLAVIAGRFAADAIAPKAVIHWPNHVVLGEARVCKIRCRARDNVMVFTFSLDTDRISADLSVQKDPKVIVSDIAAALARAGADCPDGLPKLMQAYCEKCAMLMKFVEVTYRGMPLYGFAFAVDKNGGLMVMTQESHTVVTVYSGEAKLAQREPDMPEMPPSPKI